MQKSEKILYRTKNTKKKKKEEEKERKRKRKEKEEEKRKKDVKTTHGPEEKHCRKI